jgi:hypothetical protein
VLCDIYLKKNNRKIIKKVNIFEKHKINLLFFPPIPLEQSIQPKAFGTVAKKTLKT